MRCWRVWILTPNIYLRKRKTIFSFRLPENMRVSVLSLWSGIMPFTFRSRMRVCRLNWRVCVPEIKSWWSITILCGGGRVRRWASGWKDLRIRSWKLRSNVPVWKTCSLSSWPVRRYKCLPYLITMWYAIAWGIFIWVVLPILRPEKWNGLYKTWKNGG